MTSPSPTWPEIAARLRDTVARCDRDTDLELSAGPRGIRLSGDAHQAALQQHPPAPGDRRLGRPHDLRDLAPGGATVQLEGDRDLTIKFVHIAIVASFRLVCNIWRRIPSRRDVMAIRSAVVDREDQVIATVRVDDAWSLVEEYRCRPA